MIAQVALYLRVSSEKQARDDLSISAQRKALREHAAHRGWTVAHEFVDEAESGRTADRPAFQRMLALVRRDKHDFERVLAWKYDRIGRNLRDLLVYTDELAQHGVQVESLNEPFDDSPSGRFSRNSLAGVAQLFSEMLAQDVRRGQRESVSRGRWVAARVPFGYQKNGRSLIPDPLTAPLVKRIFRDYVAGYSLEKIVVRLNTDGHRREGKPWNDAGLWYLLRNEAYTGTLVWGVGKRKGLKLQGPAIRVPHAFPALVDAALFAHVQRILQERKTARVPPAALSSRFLLTGLAVCGQCGAALLGTYTKRRSSTYWYYLCRWHVKPPPPGVKKCPARPIHAGRIEDAVLEALHAVLNAPEWRAKLAAAMRRREAQQAREQSKATRDVDQALANARGRLARLYDAVEQGAFAFADLAPRVREWRQKVAELEQEKHAREQVTVTPELFSAEELQQEIGRASVVLRKSPVIEQKQILRQWIAAVRARTDGAEIVWRVPSAAVRVHY